LGIHVHSSGSDDDDAWLDALEAGELDERGEVPSATSGLMTARQVNRSPEAHVLQRFNVLQRSVR
jgi:hypothetical protein